MKRKVLILLLFCLIAGIWKNTSVFAEEVPMIYAYINDSVLTIKPSGNSSAEAFLELLRDGDVTIEMHDYGNFEKVGPIGSTLPRNDEPITTEPGDVILYLGTEITIYYDVNNWTFTRLGKVQGLTQAELRQILGSGNVSARFSLTPPETNTDSFMNQETITTSGGFTIEKSALPYLTDDASAPVVYYLSDISAEGLMKAYAALGVELPGKVGVKMSTGESTRSNYLRPALIADLIHSVNGTIVECNTAYGGNRASTARHRQQAKDNGLLDIAELDILDEEGSMELPVEGGNVLSVDYVGTHFVNYDSYLVLSHFKGHAMAGFGGAIKNISIGFGSAQGKGWIHSGGTSMTSIWGGKQDAFLEAMADAAKAVDTFMGDNIVYINVLNRLSVDCDCDGNPAEPDMHDIAILASADPLAIDQAAIDLVYAMPDSRSLVNRIESRNGLHTLEAGAQNGLGSRNYRLVVVE